MKFHRQPGCEQPRMQWILLPGAYMTARDFLTAGFVEAVHRRGLPYEMVLLEATIPEVADGSALRFLQEFLRTDPRVPGCEVGLAGISLGAHLALACLARADCGETEQAAAARVKAACLLAPYLGPRDIVAEAGAGDGLTGWLPQAGNDDIDRRIWRWLQTGQGAVCDLHLGYGSEDRFARGHALMARTLPPRRVDVERGAHDWPTWSRLWNLYLDRHVAA